MFRRPKFPFKSTRSNFARNSGLEKEVLKIAQDKNHLLSQTKFQAKSIPAHIFNFFSLLFFGSIVYQELETEVKKEKNFKKSQNELKKVSLNDVIGIDDYKKEVEQVVDFFTNSSKYEKIGAEVTKGILLYGKPGVGKTMLAKALASESSFNFLYTSGSEFADKYFGGTSKKVKEVFAEAEKKKPCVIFIDEIDSIGAKRSSEPALSLGSNDGLNQLLHEMDGFKKHEKVIVIGATNRIEALDPALLRPGRFDTLIEIPNLNDQGRARLFDFYSKRMKFDQALDKAPFVEKMQGFTGADMKNVFNLAAINAGFLNKQKVEAKDIEQAVERVLGGNSLGTETQAGEEELRRLAYSEAAMALVARELGEAERINVLNLSNTVNKSKSLGLKGRDNLQIFNKSALMNNIQLFVSCRVAEELIFGKGDLSLLCSQRMKKARELSKTYVENIQNSQEMTALPLLIEDKTKSSGILEAQENQILAVLKKSIENVSNILTNNIGKLERLAEELMDKKSITKEEAMTLLE